MIAIVHDAYAELPLDVCKNVWTTAQLVMNQVLLCNGGNDYKLPHVDATTTLIRFSNGCVCTPAASHQLLFLVSGRRIGDLNTFGHISSIRVFYVLPYRPGDKRHFPPNFF